MDVVYTRPPKPIWDGCERVFKVSRFHGVIWAVGDKLYNPDRVRLTPWLLAHEQVHGDRQIASCDIQGWWDRYLVDPQFRFDEELVAHQKEWEVIQEHMPLRGDRRRELRAICERLSGRLYGNIVTEKKARELITGRSFF